MYSVSDKTFPEFLLLALFHLFLAVVLTVQATLKKIVYVSFPSLSSVAKMTVVVVLTELIRLVLLQWQATVLLTVSCQAAIWSKSWHELAGSLTST